PPNQDPLALESFLGWPAAVFPSNCRPTLPAPPQVSEKAAPSSEATFMVGWLSSRIGACARCSSRAVTFMLHSRIERQVSICSLLESPRPCLGHGGRKLSSFRFASSPSA